MDSWKPSSIFTPWEPQTWVFNIMAIVCQVVIPGPFEEKHGGNLSPKLYPQHTSMSIFSQHSIYRTLCTVLKLYQTHGLCSSCRLLLQIVRDLLLVTNNPSESLSTLTGTYSVIWDAVFFGLALSFLICTDLEESMNLQMELCCLALQYAEAYMLSKARSLLK